VTWALVAGLAGLAALDSLNPATLVAVTLILLGSRARPVADTLGFVAGAFLTVFSVGVVVYLGADAATDGVANGLVWVRRGAFGLAALIVLVSAVRALRPRRRSELVLPAWFNPGTAAGLGVLMTGADLPNASPSPSPSWLPTPSSTAFPASSSSPSACAAGRSPGTCDGCTTATGPRPTSPPARCAPRR